MKFTRSLFLGFLIIPGSLLADRKSELSVMTQNQFLGASLVRIISAPDLPSRNAAFITTLQSIQKNKTPERIAALADTIAERQPHFVGLQEVENISCTPADSNPGACALFAGVFSDQLQLTIEALTLAGNDYQVLASVDNLSIENVPVFLDADNIPDMRISVTDRDVILVRGDIDNARAADLDCNRAAADGCNYINNLTVGAQPIPRGYVGVDATINSKNFRFVNTHLEIPFATIENGVPIQALQTWELLGALSNTPDDTEIILVGDFNSSPEDQYPGSPYKLLAGEFTDTWTLRPGKPSGYTCCQDSDLSNIESAHDTRIDLVFTSTIPRRVKANVLDNKLTDKTVSDIWPSDHSSVSVRLQY